jgi:hypothetical protein
MDRREFLVAWLQAFLLAFFPWLRTEKGAEVTMRGARQVVDLWYPPISPDTWTSDDLSIHGITPRWHFADGVVSWKFLPAHRSRT